MRVDFRAHSSRGPRHSLRGATCARNVRSWTERLHPANRSLSTGRPAPGPFGTATVVIYTGEAGCPGIRIPSVAHSSRGLVTACVGLRARTLCGHEQIYLDPRQSIAVYWLHASRFSACTTLAMTLTLTLVRDPCCHRERVSQPRAVQAHLRPWSCIRRQSWSLFVQGANTERLRSHQWSLGSLEPRRCTTSLPYPRPHFLHLI